jgi:hypothetical protein
VGAGITVRNYGPAVTVIPIAPFDEIAVRFTTAAPTIRECRDSSLKLEVVSADYALSLRSLSYGGRGRLTNPPYWRGIQACRGMIGSSRVAPATHSAII